MKKNLLLHECSEILFGTEFSDSLTLIILLALENVNG